MISQITQPPFLLVTRLVCIVPLADRIEQQDDHEPDQVHGQQVFTLAGHDKEERKVLSDIPYIGHRVPVRKKENHRDEVYKEQMQDVIE